MKRETLTAETRTILGKKVKHLRKKGILPANVFGKGMKSVSLQLPLKDFEKVFNIVHETGLVNLVVEKETYPVLIQNVHMNYVTHTPLHADFFKVNLREKVKATIPIIGIGEPKAVTDRIGVLLQTLSEVEVEALPADLPEHIEVNIENLANIDDHLTIGDIKVPSEVEIEAEATELVFRIGELVSEEAEELAAEEEAIAEEASETSSEGEGESPDTGKSDTDSSEDKPQE